MENKINIAELLKDCPKGMELDCTMFDDVKFIEVEEDDKPICIRTGEIYRYLTKFGTWTFDENAKCVIFPKGKTTWEDFHKPFMDGEIIATDLGSVFILKSCLEDKIHYHSYFGVTCYNEIQEKQITYKHVCRLATEEEKEKLFKAIKDNGYKWNPETKTLEKLPKFKVGDRIILKDNPHNIPLVRIKAVTKSQYILENEGFFYIDSADKKYVLENKFNITTLKPFDKVLSRDSSHEKWRNFFWGFYEDSIHPFFTTCGYFKQCIPYEGNEHLLGTTNDCDDFYKTWEK